MDCTISDSRERDFTLGGYKERGGREKGKIWWVRGRRTSRREGLKRVETDDPSPDKTIRSEWYLSSFTSTKSMTIH